MATPSLYLVDALRRTAQKLESGAMYQWGHSGSCNCGHLAQEITQLTKAQIHQHAMATGRGDWNDQLNEYCATSNFSIDLIISELVSKGLALEDLQRLEYLSDPVIIKAVGRHLRHNLREDVVQYLYTWATLLEDELVSKVQLKDLETVLNPELA